MIRPKQRIKSSLKTKDWIEESVRYFSSICKPAIDLKEADILYKASNGELNESDYLYATNPYNSKDPKLTKFPSKIRNFDIISTNIMTLMGEKRKRGLRGTVIAINADIESQKKKLENELIEKYLTNQLLEELARQAQEAGQPFDMEVANNLTVEEIKKRVSNLSDKVAITAQAALDYIKSFNSLSSTTVEGWYHFLTTGMVFSYKGVIGEEVVHEIISPKEISFVASYRDRFIKDCEAVKRKWKMSVNEIIDKFQDIKGFDKISEHLEGVSDLIKSENSNRYTGYTEQDTQKQIQFGKLWENISSRGENKVYTDSEGFLVEHIVWTSCARIGRLLTISPLGDELEIDVDDTYQEVEGDIITWKWVDEKREAWIIDDNWILGGDPIYTSIGTFESPSRLENPYNGLIQRMKHANPISVTKRGIAYQIKYNIIHFYIEKAFAKNMGKITLLPIGLIPNKPGFDIDTTMYYANALGFMFIDESSSKFTQAIQAIKVLDADLGNYIGQLYNYLAQIKNEWDSQIGMTPPRKGQMSSNDGKAVQENALFRSSIMTEELFRQFEEFEETDLNGCLELSKYAFVNGKKTMFLDDDGKKSLLAVNGEDYTYWDYLVKVSNSGEDLQNLEAAKQQAQAFAQNSMQHSKVLKLLRTNNLSGLIQEMETLEEDLQKRQDAAAKQQNEALIQAEELKKETAQLNFDSKVYTADKSYQASVEVATIQTEGKLNSNFLNATGGESEIKQLNENIFKREEIRNKRDLEDKKLSIQNKKIDVDSETKKYVADTNFEIAKENKD